jgi:peptidoglycan biosynthesis protein MviN/MurJ (putative lipid II flippase)
LTGLAYVASLLRDAILAALYGGSAALDIYFIALAPSQFVATEVATLVYLSFLPQFSRAIADISGVNPRELLRDRISLVAKGTLGVAVVVAVGSILLAPLIAPRYVQEGFGRALRVSFVLLSLLIPLLGVIGVLRAFLEAHSKFVPWAVLPAFRSGVLSLVVLMTSFNLSIGWLLLGTVLGAASGLAFSWVSLGRLPTYTRTAPGSSMRTPTPFPPTVAPLVAALIVGQATLFLDNGFASRSGVGGVQAFALASNLLVIPQAIITGAVATVYFPIFGADLAAQNRDAAVANLIGSIRLVVWSAIPVVIIFCTPVGRAVTWVIYGRGAFDQTMVSLVSNTAAGLALGLVPWAVFMQMRQYVLVGGEPWIVFQVAGIFFIVKLIGNSALAGSLGVPGIAIASSFAATAACTYLALRIFGPNRGYQT